mmetsp:Transcript_8307/g.7697  ORF Transcript_8307/g.7697 Transcript_8307/m.7697 type:complete len:114 (-) Transcript_8307:1016-1357(-)
MKDHLKWKMGLRNSKKVNIHKVGLKFFNLAKNKLGTKSALLIAKSLKNDEYIRGVCLSKNKIGEAGVMELLRVAESNQNLIQMDLRGVPSFDKNNNLRGMLSQIMSENLQKAI